MQFPVGLKHGVSGAVAGAVGLSIVALSAGWVVTASTAEKMAREQSAKAVIMSLTPICVARYQQETEKPALLAALEGRSSWTRGDWVQQKGWATMPGSDTPNAQVANACAIELMKLTTG